MQRPHTNPKRKRGMNAAFSSLALRVSVVGNLLVFAHAAVAEETQPLIERLDERTRGKVILALAGLILLAFLLMGLTWLAFRVVRRRIHEARQVVEKQRGKSSDDEESARKPLT